MKPTNINLYLLISIEYCHVVLILASGSKSFFLVEKYEWKGIGKLVLRNAP